MSVLGGIQDAIADRLRSDEFLAGIPVCVEHRGDVAAQVEIALGQQGLCLIVLTPTAELQYQGSPAPFLAPKIAVRAQEYVPQNPSPLHALDIAERTLLLLHGFFLPRRMQNVVADKQSLTLAPMKDEGMSAYDALFSTSAIIGPAMLPTPRINAAQTIQITCNRPEAAIYYTLDGSYPMPANEAATLFAGAFAPPAPGTIIQAGAYLAGHIPSPINQFLVS